MLGIEIEFGTVGTDGEVEAVKWAGCAKVWGVYSLFKIKKFAYQAIVKELKN